VIIDGTKPHAVLHELFTNEGAGTLIIEWKNSQLSNIGYLI
jgi:hypothetical protein